MQRLILEIDLAQAEWVTVAYFAPEPRMIAILEEGLDPHVETGCLISGATREFVVEEASLLEHATDPDTIAELRKPLAGKWKPGWFLPRIFSCRQAGKKSNHGLNYNEGYKRFALENELQELDAEIMVKAYHQAYPGLKTMYRKIEEQLRRDQTLINYFGDKRVFRRPLSQDTLNSAYAFTPQSTVGTVGKRGFKSIYEDEWLRASDRCVIMGNVHDSIPCSIRIDNINEVAEIIARCRHHLTIPITYHDRTFTLKTDIKIGKDWGSMITLPNNSDLIEALRGTLDKLNAPVAQQ